MRGCSIFDVYTDGESKIYCGFNSKYRIHGSTSTRTCMANEMRMTDGKRHAPVPHYIGKNGMMMMIHTI